MKKITKSFEHTIKEGKICSILPICIGITGERGYRMWKTHEKRLVALSFVVASIMLLSIIGRLFS